MSYELEKFDQYKTYEYLKYLPISSLLMYIQVIFLFIVCIYVLIYLFKIHCPKRNVIVIGLNWDDPIKALRE